MSEHTAPSALPPAAPRYQQDFTPAEFAARRAAVAAAVGAAGVAVLAGLGETGAFDLFRQANEFYYLCGVEAPHAYLLVEGGTGRTTLYLPRRDAKHEASEGAQLNADEVDVARSLTGVDAVRPPEALGADVGAARAVFVPHSPAEGRQACQDTLRFARRKAEADPWDGRASREAHFRERLRAACPAAEVRDLSPVLDGLRVVKGPAEVALMRRAGRLAAEGVVEAMRRTRPGVMEYQLAAAADYVYAVNGARGGGGYRPIVAGGANIWNAHYYRNDCPLRDGDLVLMDYAPDVGGYTSDIGRMWPVNGRYSPEQRELYGFVVEYHKALLRTIRPGVTPEAVTDEAAGEMSRVVDATTWSDPAYERAAREMLAFRGHLSHPVGMAVHDVGDYFGRPLVPGTVFALDPQMWVRDRRLYVRVEDTVVVTGDGVERLTGDAPLELEDVERVMGGGR
ncbi:MAG: Xaa-Pro aminopeptidase [uncultured Phycisphaerae bacterium]|uniref:Xaa-Pro aminopeptidase n=1 Tax=uncultured Phycisphaerae bacterium TaxID=904963 RepID=A0A6J4P1C5_9BACT|nr:MAG: Xaa-Pro aminopeptidase [uncultured Phycisphaerae bacterium]